MMVLKVGLGPAAGATAIHFLGSWLGGMREDIWIHRLTTWGGVALLGAALLLVLAATQVRAEDFQDLLWLVAAVTSVPLSSQVFWTVRLVLESWLRTLAVSAVVPLTAG